MKNNKVVSKIVLLTFAMILGLSVLAFGPADQVLWKTYMPDTRATMTPSPTSSTVIKIRNIVTGGGIVLKNPTGGVTLRPNAVSIYNPPISPMVTATPMNIIPPVIWQPTPVPTYPPVVINYPTAVPRLPYDCNVSVQRPYFYEQFTPGEDFDFEVVFTNTGTQEWNTDIDVMQYTGWRMEIEGKYLYDLDKDYPSAQIVLPGQSIRWKIRMEAPKEKTNDQNKYFSTYYLVRGKDFENGRFCPFSLYVYVPQ